MSYQSIPVGTQERFFTVVQSDGAPVLPPVDVFYYLKVKSGPDSGNWWRDSDQTWQAVAVANPMAHEADGHWGIDLEGSPFTLGNRYLEYVKAEGGIHIPDSRHVIADAQTAGAGPHILTLSVTDGDDPIPSAAIRMVKGVQSNLVYTDTDGMAVVGRDAGLWAVYTTAAGYSSFEEVIVIAGDSTLEVVLTQVVIVPSDPDKVTAYLITRNAEGQPQSGVEIGIAVAQVEASRGSLYDDEERYETSGDGGLVQFSNIVRGITYVVRSVHSDKRFHAYIPADATDPHELPSMIG